MSLQVWLPLNGNLHNQGLSDVIVTNNGATVDNSGKIGKCYSFDGTDDYIDIAGVNLGNNWSYGCWFKEASSTRTWSGIIILNTNGGDSDMQLGFYSNPSTSKIQSTANGQYNSGISHTFDGQWHHLFATFDGSNLKTYRDGILINTKAITATLLPRTKLTLGARCRGSSYDCRWLGSMNDFRLYDHCLSSKEVEEISKGLVLHYKLDDPYIESTTNLASSSVGGWNNSGASTRLNNDTSLNNIKPTPGPVASIKITTAGNCALTCGTTSANHPSKTLTFSIWCYLSGPQENNVIYIRSTKTDGSVGSFEYNGSTNPSTWPVNKWIYLTKTITTASDATTFYFCTYANALDRYVALNGWQIEEKNHSTPWTAPGTTRAALTIIEDSSGYNNNGTIIGNLSTAKDSSRYSFSTYFIDYTNYISCNLGGFTPTVLTMNCWIKSINKSPRGSYHLPLNISGTNNEISIASNGSARMGYVISGTRYVYDNSGDVLNGKWHMLTNVYNGSAIVQYIDGVQVRNQAITGSMTALNAVGVGQFPNGTTYGNTQLYESDVRIYITALTAAQIKELYDTSVSIDSFGNIHAREVVEI